jgi:hypothetical protein
MPWSRSFIRIAGAASAIVVFLAYTERDVGTRGIISEEVEPYLTRYPRVLERGLDGRIDALPPYESGARAPHGPHGPHGWVATSEWPVVGYDGATRLWPVFVRGHQSALGSYLGIALGPLLGGGIAGVRRSNAWMALFLIAGTFLLARRLSLGLSVSEGGLAALILGSSFGVLWCARTAYGFELASRLFALLALFLAAERRPLSWQRSAFIGVAVGLAVLCRATILAALAPALAVLLSDPLRLPRLRTVAPTFVGAFAIPFVAYFAVGTVAPFFDGTGPFDPISFTAWPTRLFGVLRQLGLQLTWLGDASMVMRPIYGDGTAISSYGWPTPVAAVPLIVGLWRWYQKTATDAERMFVCATVTSVFVGASIYPGPNDFQLALALEPLFALALAAQIALLARPLAQVAGLAVILCHVHGAWVGLKLDRSVSNPMLSGRTQRAALAELRALGVRGPEVLTVRYHQVGVLEAWSEGAIRPTHAWPLFSGVSLEKLSSVWRELLSTERPRYLLLADGYNLCEGDQPDGAQMARGLDLAARELDDRLTPIARFPTESGAAGWSLVRVDPLALKAPAEAPLDGAPPPPPPVGPARR